MSRMAADMTKNAKARKLFGCDENGGSGKLRSQRQSRWHFFSLPRQKTNQLSRDRIGRTMKRTSVLHSLAIWGATTTVFLAAAAPFPAAAQKDKKIAAKKP